MQETSRCWVCHRDVAEIVAAVDVESQEEKEVKKQMSQVAWHKSKFAESADLWRKSLPRDFKDMDFQFVASNGEQFGSIKVLGEVLDAKKLMLDWLVETSSSLRKDGKQVQETPELAGLDKSDKEGLLRLIDQFEAKWKRSLSKDKGSGYASGFEGLKLFEGLEFLISEGQLYYDVRAQMCQAALGKAASKKPRKGVRSVQFNGYPAVPLCSVCESLILGLRLPERKSVQEVPEEVEESPKSEPQKVVQEVAVVQASSAVQDEDSSKVPEAVKRLGTVSKEAVRTRPLHDHRAKEEWDEILEKRAEGVKV